MNVPSALSVAQITLYLAAVAAVVSALITQFVQPLVNRVPALAPNAPDGTLRNLVLRGVNLVLSVVGVLGLAAVAGQLSLTNLIPTTAAVVMVMLGAHGFYKLIPSPSAPVAPSTPPAAPSALPLQTAPAATTPPLPVAGLSLPDGSLVTTSNTNSAAPMPVAIGGPANEAKQPS